VFCGQCDFCIAGKPNLCTKEATRRPFDKPQRLSKDGAPVFQFLDLSSFAEQMLVHEGAIVKITKDMPLDRAALIGCGVTTGLGAVLNTAGVRAGETVAVVGCGGVGLSAIQGAAIAGAGRIIAVDMVESKLQLAKEFGATDFVNAGDGDPVAAVRGITGGRGVDAAFEVIGLGPTVEQAINMTRNGGEAILVGVPRFDVMLNLNVALTFLYTAKTIKGCWYGSTDAKVDVPKLLDLYKKGELKLDELISREIGLEDVNAAFDAMKAGEVARSVIVY
jgi:S-(hydroxymethyl)glutathione dehydrogenase/alcohol dehydrogenase